MYLQVVAGVNWSLKVEVAITDCLKEEVQDNLSSCSIDPQEVPHVCHMNIWEKPWLKQKTLSYIDCLPKSSESAKAL